MWQCTFYFSCSFQIMHLKLKNACPVSNKSEITTPPNQGVFYRENEMAEIKPDKHVIGRIIISTTRCPKLLFLWPRLNLHSWIIVTSYKFQIDTVLKLNVTFLDLELLKPEKVEVINGNTCKNIQKNLSLIPVLRYGYFTFLPLNQECLNLRNFRITMPIFLCGTIYGLF